MFLDRQLRALEADKKRLALHAELNQRLAQLEVLSAKSAVRRLLSGPTLGVTLAGWIHKLLRHR